MRVGSGGGEGLGGVAGWGQVEVRVGPGSGEGWGLVK